MTLWKKKLYEEYINNKYKKSFNIDNWFKYSGLVEHNNKIKFKQYTDAIDKQLIDMKTIVIKNDILIKPSICLDFICLK